MFVGISSPDYADLAKTNSDISAYSATGELAASAVTGSYALRFLPHHLLAYVCPSRLLAQEERISHVHARDLHLDNSLCLQDPP